MAGMNPRKRGRLLRQRRIRKQVRGTDSRPRLCVYRSNKHLYAQIISDENGRALAAVSTLSAELKDSVKAKTATVSAAEAVGQLIAKKCQERGIRTVVFDRNGFLFHGRIRAVAKAAQEAGLQF